MEPPIVGHTDGRFKLVENLRYTTVQCLSYPLASHTTRGQTWLDPDMNIL